MYFAQFFIASTGYVAGTIPPQVSRGHIKPTPACGPHGVARLEGRLSSYGLHKRAAELALHRGFTGYQICKGESLGTGKPITIFNKVERL